MEVVRSCETSEQMYDPTWCDNPEGDRTLMHAIYVCSALKFGTNVLWRMFVIAIYCVANGRRKLRKISVTVSRW
jgi:hypothetical protein